jgi:hypothetical protein
MNLRQIDSIPLTDTEKTKLWDMIHSNKKLTFQQFITDKESIKKKDSFLSFLKTNTNYSQVR